MITYKDLIQSTSYEEALAYATKNFPKILHYTYDELGTDIPVKDRKIDLEYMAETLGYTVSFCSNMLQSDTPLKGVLFKQIMIIIDMSSIGAKAFGMTETSSKEFESPFDVTDPDACMGFIHDNNISIKDILQISEDEFKKKLENSDGFEFLYDLEFEKVLKFIITTGLPINFLFYDFYTDCRGFCE